MPEPPVAAGKPGPCPRPIGCAPLPLAGRLACGSVSDSGNPSVTLTRVGRVVATKVRVWAPPKPSLQILNELTLAAGACREASLLPAPMPFTRMSRLAHAPCVQAGLAPRGCRAERCRRGAVSQDGPCGSHDPRHSLACAWQPVVHGGKSPLQGVFGKLSAFEKGPGTPWATLPSVLPQAPGASTRARHCAPRSFKATLHRPHFPRACKSLSASCPHTAATATCLLAPTSPYTCVRRTQLRPVGGQPRGFSRDWPELRVPRAGSCLTPREQDAGLPLTT